MVNVKRLRVLAFFSFLAGCVALIYLIWWDQLGVYPGYVDIDFLFGLWPNLALLILVVSIGVSFYLAKRSRYFLLILLPSLLCVGYFARIQHGLAIAQFEGCDMSICDKLVLYPDGAYYFKTSSQNETKTHWGSYQLKQDTLFFSMNKGQASLAKSDRIKLKSISCFVIRSEKFRMQIGERVCKID
ncbi:MAG: hypothetical protein EP332_09605 [Bacteroidetes bacterium]|nr:MAG: hypothetical protein EP332_09605 [Bacteroidota bacterium]